MSGIELHPAAHWRPENGAVRCELCPHRCLISEGKRGICKVREHQKGRLFALTYGKVSAVQFDPMEKKPLYHFHPGKPILSIGSVGCNFHCGFCQNHHLVECAAPLAPVPIPDLVRAARREGAVGISYTYNEPLIWFEFVVDCAREFRKAGMANVLVTNGFVSPEPLAELLPLVDAMNIDLKSMDPEFYSEESIRSVVDFVAGVDPEIPLHLSRYMPMYRFTAPPTPPERLAAAFRIAREKLPYVYVGNYPLEGAEDTACPECGAIVVRRNRYRTNPSGLTGNRCASCSASLRFVV
jgi:pyruvate formate lyase activating enzyme